MNKIKAVHAKYKKRQTGKCLYFKNCPLLFSQNISKELEASEKVTKIKKNPATRNCKNHKNRRNRRKNAKSSDEDVTSSVSNSSDSSSDSEVEILD